MKKLLVLPLVLAVSGCGGAGKFMQKEPAKELYTKCQMQAQEKNAAGNLALSRLNMGQSEEMVNGILGAPVREDKLKLADGRQVRTAFYQTSHTLCLGRKAQAQTVFVPAVFHNDRLIGYGAGYYNLMIKPVVVESAAAVAKEKKKAEEKAQKDLENQVPATGVMPQFVPVPYPVYYPVMQPVMNPYMVPAPYGQQTMVPSAPPASGTTIIIPLDE